MESNKTHTCTRSSDDHYYARLVYKWTASWNKHLKGSLSYCYVGIFSRGEMLMVMADTTGSYYKRVREGLLSNKRTSKFLYNSSQSAVILGTGPGWALSNDGGISFGLFWTLVCNCRLSSRRLFVLAEFESVRARNVHTNRLTDKSNTCFNYVV